MAYLIEDQQLPADVAERLRARRAAMLDRLEARARRDGQVLFELEWMTPEEARRAYRAMRRRGWGTLAELAALYTVLFFGVGVMAQILVWVLGF